MSRRWRARWSTPAPRRHVSAATSARGTAEVVLYAPSREGPEGDASWLRLASPGLDKNATLDAVNESETFLTVVPGNRKRFVVGANGGGGYNAWITTMAARASPRPRWRRRPT